MFFPPGISERHHLPAAGQRGF